MKVRNLFVIVMVLALMLIVAPLAMAADTWTVQ